MHADHGGNLRALAEEAGLPAATLLDWSANVNPLGVSPKVRAVLEANLDTIVQYPDPDARALRGRLAAFHDVPADSILVGNGETELIYLAAQAFRPRRALILVPVFSEYAHALALVGGDRRTIGLEESRGFLPDLAAVIEGLEGCDAVILTNPNNPTGSLIPSGDIMALVEACEARSVLCLIDEAFIDWHEEHSLKGLAARARHVLVLRSLTKFYALPGLRIGYAIGAWEGLAQLRRWQPTWSVNALAQLAGIAALDDAAYRAASLEMLPRARGAFRSALSEIEGLRVFPSVANFLLLKVTAPAWDAASLRTALLAKGMAVRDASAFEGLGPRYLRVAIRLPEENARLVEALRGLLSSPR